MPLLADLLFSGTLLPHLLYHRLFTGKYGPQAYEKLGYVRARPGDRPCLWTHAVSVGEAIAARPLLEAFGHAHPGWDVRVTTTTATGRKVASERFGADRVSYYPLDLSWMVRRAFDRLRPDLVVLMELEVWPNFLAHAEQRGVPVVVANARITERSTRRFRRWRRISQPMLTRVTEWLAQSETYAERLRSIGVPPGRIHVVGSIKYDAVPTELDPSIREQYRRLLGADEGTRVLIGGSTHPSEEEVLLEAFACLEQEGLRPLKLVLVPRHPERLDAVDQLAARRGRTVRRSAITPQGSTDAPIVLVDTLGELGKLYAAADAVFVGGTLIPHGGQNMMEPCGLGRPTVIGPSTHNFDEPVAVLRAAKGLRQIQGPRELLPALRELFTQPEQAAALGANAREALIAEQGATERTLDRLRRTMPARTD